MDGIQKTVVLGLRYLADRVEEGTYGIDEKAFDDEVSREAFIEDFENEVIGKME